MKTELSIRATEVRSSAGVKLFFVNFANRFFKMDRAELTYFLVKGINGYGAVRAESLIKKVEKPTYALTLNVELNFETIPDRYMSTSHHENNEPEYGR